jgi:hypothetical protein
MNRWAIVIRPLRGLAISIFWDCGENERQPRPQSRQPKPYRRWQMEIAERHNVSESDTHRVLLRARDNASQRIVDTLHELKI